MDISFRNKGAEKDAKLRFFRVSNKYLEDVEATAADPRRRHQSPAMLRRRTGGKAVSCRRKIVTKLWTKSHGAIDNAGSLFPSCKNLVRAIDALNRTEIRRLSDQLATWTIPDPHDVQSITAMMSDCHKFRHSDDFADRPASNEEADYPLAYVFLPFKNMPQAVRFFRMIYQPQNVYCITYDTKASEAMKRSIAALASCFPENVMVNPNLGPIYYSTFTLLHSVTQCIDLLRSSPVRWRYVQIVSWNDFPLKTNWEMVRVFKALNGSQDSELTDIDFPHFVTYQHGVDDAPFARSDIPRPIPPAGVTLYKGSFATTMSREFVQFMFTDSMSVQLYNYFNDSQFPDESYWATLIHNTQLNAPGAFPGQCALFFSDAGRKKPWISRFQVWDWTENVNCGGYFERISFCIYGIRDLETLLCRMELFAHKLYEQYQTALLYCLEDWYWTATCLGKDTGLNESYYRNLPSVKYHNLPNKEAKDSFVCVE